MTLDDAMRAACDAAGVKAPPSPPPPGKWKRLDTQEKNGRGDASILIFDDRRGGIVQNWQTLKQYPFRLDREAAPLDPKELARLRREAEARRQREAEEGEIAARVAADIVRTATADRHPYLEAKGFPDEFGMVHAHPTDHMPRTRLGEAMAKAMPEGDGPWLIVPGRIGKRVVTVQFISASGAKKNLLRGQMAGAAHRIASGRETWVCEGIATAMSVRAALRFLGRSATVLSAFSASNVASVAQAIPGAIIAADHDKPVETFDGQGTGEYYARRSGCVWIMPPAPGDWNDHHMRKGLRAVALLLREVRV